MEKYYESTIENPSQKAIEDLFLFLTNSESISMDFLADGIEKPYFQDRNANLKEYKESCDESNVKYFSSQDIHYTPEFEKSGLLNSIFDGEKRINKISVNIKEENGFDVMKKFKDLMFPLLLRNYFFSSGHIMLSGHDHSEPEGMGGRWEDAGIYLNWGGGKGLRLSINDECSEDKKTNYIKLFDMIKKREFGNSE